MDKQEYLNNLKDSNPNLEIIGEYIDIDTKCKFKCLDCGYVFDALPYKYIKSTNSVVRGCYLCKTRNAARSRRINHEDFERIVKKNNPDLTLVSKYIKSKESVTVKCNKCGKYWTVQAGLLKRRNSLGCRHCVGGIVAKRKTKSNEDFKKELKRKNPNVILLSEYTKATNYVEVKCRKCGYVSRAKAYTLLQGRICPNCRTVRGVENNKGKTKKKSTKDFVSELKKINDSIMVVSEYKSHHNFVSCVCKKCGHRWDAKAYSLLQGHGCPRCAKSGTSFMEQYIYLCFCWALGKDNVFSRDRKTIGMELDIYLPKYNLAIEPGNWFLHKKNIKRDQIKRNLCAQKNIELITIYDKFPKNEKAPFDNNCYVFNEDLNKADRFILNNLIYKLFYKIGCKKSIPDKVLKNIEAKAYENAKSMTHNEFVNRMDSLHPNIQVIGKYENSNKRIKVICKDCGYEWLGVPANMLSGDGCWKCGRKITSQKLLKSQKVIEKEINQVNPNIEIIGEYKGRHKPIKARCKICGHEWEPVVASLLRGSSHKGSKSMHKKLNL